MVLLCFDPDERKPLIPHPNPVSKPPNGTDWLTPSVPSARTDEQALLTSILTKTAQNIIDVSAADSVMMEQHEYMDKARQYRYVGKRLGNRCRGRLLLLCSFLFCLCEWIWEACWPLFGQALAFKIRHICALHLSENGC
uniref:Ragulator complex protein LAMTOR1 n=1 Tax=Sparus aurata TaxID=8175 RepID=A0A671VG62_SPAAU